MDPSQSVFIDLTPEAQLEEIRAHLISLKADLPAETTATTICSGLKEVIAVSDVLFKEGASEGDLEMVLNSIVSLIVFIEDQESNDLILTFIEKVSEGGTTPKVAHVSLRVLWLLFQSIAEKRPIRYDVYYHILKVSKQTEQVKAVFSSVKELNATFAKCEPPLSVDKTQNLLRFLHEVLLACKETELAAKVMMELLGTYTTENAGQAREDAIRCIISALADPHTFLLDPLMALKPVKCLQGELVHTLLNIFVQEKLSDYLAFYESNREFVVGLGLDHEQNLTKMRLLTFMQLAEVSTEMSFDTILKELLIQEDQVEAFIIEVLKTKLVRARMDQAARKVFIASTMHRTFDRPQWQQLRDTLVAWKNNLLTVQDGMKSIVAAQMEAAYVQ